MLPCVVRVLGFSQQVVLAAARRPPWPTQFGDFPRKDALDARLPPPTSRHAISGNRSNDLSVVRPTLSPVELTGYPCVCLCVCVPYRLVDEGVEWQKIAPNMSWPEGAGAPPQGMERNRQGCITL